MIVLTRDQRPKFNIRHHAAIPPTFYTRDGFMEARLKLEVSRELLAEIMGIAPSILRNIEDGGRNIPVYVRRFMDVLVAHPEMIVQLVKRR